MDGQIVFMACLVLNAVLTADGSCRLGQHECEIGGKCIPDDWKCDGEYDCFQGTDERGCSTKSCANSGEFQCDDGKCIHALWVCDGDTDCADGSDEFPDNCDARQLTPTPATTTDISTKSCANSREFQCDDGKCIPALWVCDGFTECSDGSDEFPDICDARQLTTTPATTTDISRGTCPKSDEFQCRGDGTCIKSMWVCDGDIDCHDGSDEECGVQSCVVSEHSKCDDGQCIETSFFCDGTPDCVDQSDEDPKHCAQNTCESSGMFKCDNGACIPTSFVCDHDVDCPDKSDEAAKTCGLNLRCAAGKFNCTDGTACVDLNRKCDRIRHCPDGSDERDCPTEACKAGFEPAAPTNGRTNSPCVDIDECQTRGSCSQTCFNTVGDFKCQCLDGYTLMGRRRCTAASGQVELLVSDDLNIRRYNPASRVFTPLLDTRSVPEAVYVNYDLRNNLVFWATVTGTIHSINLQDGTEQSILSGQVMTSQVDGIALDWVHRNIYVVVAKILVTRYDGSSTKILVTEGMRSARDIVVDPLHGWMYWSDWGNVPKIEKCGMNGNDRRAIVTEHIYWPNGLDIDFAAKRLYFSDAHLNRIASTDLDGRDYFLVSDGDTSFRIHPFSVAVFEDLVYWSDWLHMAVFKANKFGREHSNTTLMATDVSKPYAVVVYHIYKQPIVLNHCGSDYGGCSHLCLPTPQRTTGDDVTRSYECACPTGMVLYYDDKTCVDADGFTSTTEQSTSTMSSENPSTQMSTETPTTQILTENPTTRKTTEIPTTKKTTEKLTTRKSTEKLTTRKTTEKLTTRKTTENPTTKKTTKIPTTKKIIENPTTKKTTEKLTTRKSTEKLTTRKTTEKLTTRKTTENPTTKKTTKIPTTKKIIENPTTKKTTEKHTTPKTTEKLTTQKTTKIPTIKKTTEKHTTLKSIKKHTTPKPTQHISSTQKTIDKHTSQKPTVKTTSGNSPHSITRDSIFGRTSSMAPMVGEGTTRNTDENNQRVPALHVNGTHQTSDDGSSGMATGTLAGIIIAVIVGLLIIIVIIAVLFKRHKKQNKPSMNFSNPSYTRTDAGDRIHMEI